MIGDLSTSADIAFSGMKAQAQRLKVIANILSTIIMLGFAATIIVYYSLCLMPYFFILPYNVVRSMPMSSAASKLLSA